MADEVVFRLRSEIERLEQLVCDECDGSGEYLIDGEPRTCICVGETAPYQKMVEALREISALGGKAGALAEIALVAQGEEP